LLEQQCQKEKFQAEGFDLESSKENVLSFFKKQYAENNKINVKLRSWDIIFAD
jgi:hypothetical protein